MTDPTRVFRVVGLVSIASTPITSFFSYAMVAIAIGEAHLEGPDGLTVAGYVALALPAILGAGLLVWSRRAMTSPSRRSVGLVSVGVALACAGLGLSSVTRSSADGDASIGGALLVLASIPIATGALVLLFPTIRSIMPRPPVG